LKLRSGIWNKHFATSVKVHSLIQALALGRKKLLDSIKEQETYWSGDLKSGKRNVEQAFWNKHESAFSDTISRLMKKDFAWFYQKWARNILKLRSEICKRNLQQAFSTSMKVHSLIQSLALWRKILLDSLRKDQEAYCSVEIQHLLREINRITWGDLCVFKELWTSRVDCDDNCSSEKCIWILLLHFISFSSEDFPPILFSSRKESEEDARKSLSKTSYY